MLNILIPLAGKNTFEVSKSNSYPKILKDVGGKLLIEWAAQSYVNIQEDKKIVVATPENNDLGFNFDKMLGLLDKDLKVCHISNKTQGAVCSALLAIEELELDQPLIVSSFEQVLDIDVSDLVKMFSKNDADAGVLTFEAIHPKWSFVKCDDNGLVTQAAEKQPISKQAIAGFYYFKTASLFVESAKQMIRKGVKHKGLFYVSHTLNEIILNGGKVLAVPIEKSSYYHINDEQAFDKFEESIFEKNVLRVRNVKSLTNRYVDSFNSKRLESISQLISDEFTLIDPAGEFYGKETVLNYISDIFQSVQNLEFIANNIFVDGLISIIEFELKIDEKLLVGTDVIHWNEANQMSKLDAYLYEKVSK